MRIRVHLWFLSFFLTAGLCLVFSDSDESLWMQPVTTGEATALPEASEIMRRVRAHLPPEAYAIDAKLKLNRQNAANEIFQAEMTLRWGAQPPSASYRIQDYFGADLAHVNMTWSEAGKVSVTDLSKLGITNSYQNIPEIDLSLADLSFDFLWWNKGKTQGLDEKKGRRCYVIDLEVPADRTSDYSTIRLWVDAKAYFVIEAKAFNKTGDELRRYVVKKIKKIDERWMLKIFEIEYPQEDRSIKVILNNIKTE